MLIDCSSFCILQAKQERKEWGENYFLAFFFWLVVCCHNSAFTCDPGRCSRKHAKALSTCAFFFLTEYISEISHFAVVTIARTFGHSECFHA